MFVLKYRVSIIIVLIGLTVFLGFGLKRLTKENGIEALISTENSEYLFFKSMEREFGATDQIVLGVTFVDSVYKRENLSLIRDLSSFFEGDEDIEDDNVLSLSTIDNIDGVDQELIVGPIIPNDEEITDNTAETIKSKVRDNDMLKGKIVSNDEKSTAIIIPILRI